MSNECNVQVTNTTQVFMRLLDLPNFLKNAAAAGATAVVHPGASVRDAEVIAAADEHGLAVVLTGRRHFRH